MFALFVMSSDLQLAFCLIVVTPDFLAKWCAGEKTTAAAKQYYRSQVSILIVPRTVLFRSSNSENLEPCSQRFVLDTMSRALRVLFVSYIPVPCTGVGRPIAY